MAFVAGHSQGVTFQLDGAGGATALNVTGHDWAEEVNSLVTTHTGSSGKQARIAGILDGQGNVEANVDAAALVNATAPGVVAGAKGTINFSIGGATAIIAHVMVQRLNWKSVVNGLVTYNFRVEMDSTSGSYTRPT